MVEHPLEQGQRCEHGREADLCPVCARDRRIAELETEVEQWKDKVAELRLDSGNVALRAYRRGYDDAHTSEIEQAELIDTLQARIAELEGLVADQAKVLYVQGERIARALAELDPDLSHCENSDLNAIEDACARIVTAAEILRGEDNA